MHLNNTVQHHKRLYKLHYLISIQKNKRDQPTTDCHSNCNIILLLYVKVLPSLQLRFTTGQQPHLYISVSTLTAWPYNNYVPFNQCKYEIYAADNFQSEQKWQLYINKRKMFRSHIRHFPDFFLSFSVQPFFKSNPHGILSCTFLSSKKSHRFIISIKSLKFKFIDITLPA